MIILGIETSCDETAISIIEVAQREAPHFRVLANVLISQIKIHEQYGGVFPMVAKREHAKNLTPLLHKALLEAGLIGSKILSSKKLSEKPLDHNILDKVKNILIKENGLYEQLTDFFTKDAPMTPPVDAIAVTSGPGLEPALWVGISFAKALAAIWCIPVVPVNHMEGHIVGSLLQGSTEKDIPTDQPLKSIEFPALALLISGGHTELVEINGWRQYKIIGRTRDDAVGEAFDKVARLLGLPYPGGPEISKLAKTARSVRDRAKISTTNVTLPTITLPRPMIHSGDLDFSFSGLKTAVLYLLKKINPENKVLAEDTKQEIACEFEDAVTDCLTTKTETAIDTLGIRTIIIGGGVIANDHIRNAFEKIADKRSLTIYLPNKILATDNALMIAIAGYFVFANTPKDTWIKKTDIDGILQNDFNINIKAVGNLSL